MTREEAIEIINRNCTEGSKLREACAMFIPELAESEDERIRKGLIELIENWNYPQELFTTKQNIIAYLQEKIAKASKTWEGVDADKYLDEVRDREQEQPEVELEKASRSVYESWKGGTMDDFLRDMVELGKALNARKEK